MKQSFFLLTAALFIFSALNLAAQKPVELQLTKSKIYGNVSKVTEGRLMFYEEWGESKSKMYTNRVTWYDANGRRILSRGERVVSQYSYLPDGRISRVSYSWASGPIGEELEYLKPEVASDTYFYTSNGKLGSITFNDPIQDGYRSTDIRNALYYDNCLDYPYECEAGVADEAYQYSQTTKIVFNYAADGSYQVILCDADGKTRAKSGVSSDGRLVLNSWGLCEYDQSGRLLAWGGQAEANNGAAKWSYRLGYDKRENLVIESGKEDLVKEVDKAPWLTESAKYYGADVFEYEYDDKGNWTKRTHYEIDYGGKKNEKYVWGRTIEYGKYLDLNAKTKGGDSLAESNKAEESEYVTQRFKELLFERENLNTTDFNGNPVHDMDKIVSVYIQYQSALNDYQMNSDAWPKSEKKNKYKEIQTLGSQLYELAGINGNDSYANEQWYKLLSLIWGMYMKPDDDISSNIYVALDALEKLSEINDNLSFTRYSLMYYAYLIPDNKVRSEKGLTPGQAYKAHSSGLEMNTKAWTIDMFKIDPNFYADFYSRVTEFQNEFKETHNLNDNYLPKFNYR